MKVSGFTFIRNAIKYDYPIVEAIQSILPLCHEVVVAVGHSEDESRDLIRSIDPSKIRIIDTIWDDDLREGGKVLAVETNKAFAGISKDSDWGIYIQGDEVIHEKYLPIMHAAMKADLKNSSIDGFLFHYLHFYGSYDYVGSSSKWYPYEIRIVRNDPKIYSYRDAQGFRKGENEKLTVKLIDAYVYHYGWVKEPEAMQRKQASFHKLWHDDLWVEQHIPKADAFDYLSHIKQLKAFQGTHPEVMQKRIEQKNWKFNYDLSYNKRTFKDRLKSFLKKYLGLDFGYKNYILKR